MVAVSPVRLGHRIVNVRLNVPGLAVHHEGNKVLLKTHTRRCNGSWCRILVQVARMAVSD
jgi:hypothetical protein